MIWKGQKRFYTHPYMQHHSDLRNAANPLSNSENEQPETLPCSVGNTWLFCLICHSWNHLLQPSSPLFHTVPGWILLFIKNKKVGTNLSQCTHTPCQLSSFCYRPLKSFINCPLQSQLQYNFNQLQLHDYYFNCAQVWVW